MFYFRENHFAPAVVLVVLSLLYLLFNVLYGRQETADEIYFKAPGLNWAQSGHFNAPQLANDFRETPVPVEKLFFQYPPVYSILFGVFVKIFNFGWRQCVIFDAIIHIMLILSTYLCAKQLYKTYFTKEPIWLSLVPALLIFPIGQTGRPDELAMVFGMFGIYQLIGHAFQSTRSSIRQVTRLIISASLFGLCALTSAGASIVLGLIILFVILMHPSPLKTRFNFCLLWGIIALFVASVGVMITILDNPLAYKQYTGIAGTQVLNAGSRIHALKFIVKFGYEYICIIFYGMLIFLLGEFILRKMKKNKTTIDAIYYGIFMAIIFLQWVLPMKYTYLWFFIPILMVNTVLVMYLVQSRHKTIAGIVFLALVLLLPVIYLLPARSALIQVTLEKKQQAAYNESFLQSVIPEGSKVLVGGGWWFIGRRNEVLDAVFSDIEDLSSIEYITLTANGSGRPGIPHAPLNSRYNTLLKNSFYEIANNLKNERTKFLSFPISKSGWGHGVAVYKKKESD